MNKPKLMLVQKLVKDNHFEQAHEPDTDHQLTGAVPVMTWADWHLLQELHKARKVQHITVNFDGDAEALRKLLDSAPGGKVEILPTPESEVIAELQDQIQDWEAKCKHLESERYEVLKSREIVRDLKNRYLAENQRLGKLLQDTLDENEQLSKSLQHYRAAYFADSVHTGTGTQPGTVTGGAGIHFGGAGQGGAK